MVAFKFHIEFFLIACETKVKKSTKSAYVPALNEAKNRYNSTLPLYYVSDLFFTLYIAFAIQAQFYTELILFCIELPQFCIAVKLCK